MSSFSCILVFESVSNSLSNSPLYADFPTAQTTALPFPEVINVSPLKNGSGSYLVATES